MKKINNTGSLTVEAALSLPIFIYAILFISYFIRILYVQEDIQHALDQTANQMAVYAYIYDEVGIKDLQQEVYSSYASQSEGLVNAIDQVMASGTGAYTSIQDLWQIGSSVQAPPLSEVSEIETVGGLNGLIDSYKQQITGVIGQVEATISNLMAQIHEISDNMARILEYKDQLGSAAKREGFEYLIDTVGIQGAKLIFKEYINEEQLINYSIIEGEKGLDFGRSQFLLEDDTIDLVLSYRIKIPIPLPIVDEIPLIQRVTVRAWTGFDPLEGNGGSDGSEDESEKEMVLVTRSSLQDPSRTVYHTRSDCQHIQRIVSAKQLSEVAHLDPCEICVDDKTVLPETMTVYMTSKAGDHYHIDRNCGSITRYVFELPLEELENPVKCAVCAKKE